MSLSEGNNKCVLKRLPQQDPACGECGEAARMECLLCLKAGARPSPVFCSMDCYRRHWKTHRAAPGALLPKSSPFPGKIFQGSQPFSSTMLPVQSTSVRQRHAATLAPPHPHHSHAVMSPMMYQHPMHVPWPMMHSVPDPVRKS